MGAASSRCLGLKSGIRRSGMQKVDTMADSSKPLPELLEISIMKSARQEVASMVDWSKLLPELLELISDRLPLLDFITFRSVCHQWRLAPSGRTEITKFPKDQEWLMLYGIENCSNESGRCYLYSCSHSKCCTVYLPELEGATIMQSKFGWFLAHRSEHFFLFNFFTLENINLPEHAVTSDQACTFTTFPTNKDCTVFIVSRRCDSVIELSSCRIHDDKHWKVKTVNIFQDWVGFSLLGVFCCSCSYDYSVCDCSLKNKIGMYGTEKSVYYDYANETVSRRDHKPGKCAHNFNDPKVVHGNDWLSRFGERDVLISICARGHRDGNFVGTATWKYGHTTSGVCQPNAELKGVLMDFKHFNLC